MRGGLSSSEEPHSWERRGGRERRGRRRGGRNGGMGGIASGMASGMGGGSGVIGGDEIGLGGGRS